MGVWTNFMVLDKDECVSKDSKALDAFNNCVALDELWLKDYVSRDDNECIWDNGNVTWLCREIDDNEISDECSGLLVGGYAFDDIVEYGNCVS